MRNEFQEGDRVRLLVEGKWRDLQIETLTSDRRLAQCSWMERTAKHYVTCKLDGLKRMFSEGHATAVSQRM
jgi:hypothetical protein